MKPYVAGQNLYLNADKSRVVEAGNSEAAYLLIGVGSELAYEDAVKYGLIVEAESLDEAPAAPKAEVAESSAV